MADHDIEQMLADRHAGDKKNESVASNRDPPLTDCTASSTINPLREPN